jgi:hypothetical protein
MFFITEDILVNVVMIAKKLLSYTQLAVEKLI